MKIWRNWIETKKIENGVEFENGLKKSPEYYGLTFPDIRGFFDPFFLKVSKLDKNQPILLGIKN